jgi:site-specific recombinase XerD
MPQLYFTDIDALGRPLEPRAVAVPLPTAGDDAEALGLVDGVPFILGDDGSYDLALNRFFRECPSMGVRSPNSVKAYARDILTFMRFLDERRSGKGLWRADRQDLIAFHRARRLSDRTALISAASWNRAVTALEKLYGWACEEGLVAATPFAARVMSSSCRAPVHAKRRSPGSFREAAARRHNMRYVGMDHFLSFRDIGLRARLPDGREDPVWRGRHGERDALFAELLVTTGLRLEEASSLIPADLPRHDDPLLGEARSCPVGLPAAICKGGKGREVRVPRRLLRRIDDYIAIERTNAVACWRVRHGWERMRASIPVRGWSRGLAFIDIAGGLSRRRLDGLSPSERARLVVPDTQGQPAEPASLWLTGDGRPIGPAAWEAVFLRAEARCRARGLDLHVTPHMLRHTFAVHMLSLLIREQIGAVVAGPDHRSAVYRRVIGDPLQKLQRLLGHASIASTYIYLDSLEEARALVEAAAARLAEDLDAPFSASAP